MSQKYAHPEYLASTQWIEENLDNTNIRLVESNGDILVYESGHIPGAVNVDWFTTLQNPVRRNFLTKDAFEELCSNLSIMNDTTVVFYGDKTNWFVFQAFCLFEYYGHEKLRIMDGGTQKWELEKRPLTKTVSGYQKTGYIAKEPNENIRAYRHEIITHIQSKSPLIEVRSPQEFRGELLHMPRYLQEGAMRGGHIPGALNIPWSQIITSESTLKSVDELRKLYQDKGITPDNQIIDYCRIGEHSSHTWFVF